MRRLLALPLVVTAALALAAPAQAEGVCTPVRIAGACAGYECVDLCGPRPYAYTYCENPLPAACNIDLIELVRGGR
jgi:hypothetical protein